MQRRPAPFTTQFFRNLGMSDTITAIVEAQEKYGEVTDEKAKNVIALYGSLLEMNEKAGADGNDSVRNAGYVLYW
jgi:hypothetical protein